MPQLIYLDTSNLIHLTDARAKEPGEHARAVASWRGAGAKLALSRVHLVELRRHDEPETRAERVRTIQDLVPVRTDIGIRQNATTRPLTMTEREIIQAVIHDNVLSLPGSELSSLSLRLPVGATTAFPFSWDDAASVNTLRSYDDPTFRAFMDLVHEGVEGAVATLTRPASTPYHRMRLKDLSDVPLTPMEVAMMEQQFASAISDAGSLPAIVSGLPAGVMQEVLREQVELLRTLYRRAAQVGLRLAWAEANGVEGDITRDNRPLDQIARAWQFRRTAEGVMREVFRIDPNRAADLAKHIPVESCPGTWLSQAVDLQIRKGETSTAASSAYDIDHLVYFPYVDRFFGDKRTRQNTEAALRLPDCPSAIRGRTGPIFVPRSVEQLTKAFENL